MKSKVMVEFPDRSRFWGRGERKTTTPAFDLVYVPKLGIWLGPETCAVEGIKIISNVPETIAWLEASGYKPISRERKSPSKNITFPTDLYITIEQEATAKGLNFSQEVVQALTEYYESI